MGRALFLLRPCRTLSGKCFLFFVLVHVFAALGIVLTPVRSFFLISSKSLLALAVSASLIASGCTSTSGGYSGGSSSNADPRMTGEGVDVNETSYITACLTGAALVGVACMFIADSDQRAVCIASAAAGCALFMGGNALLDNIRTQYHTREQQLDALIAEAQKSNQTAKNMAAASQAVYKDESKKFAQLQKDIKARKATKQQLNAQIAQYNGNIKMLEDNLDVHMKSLDSLKQARTGIVGNGKGLTTAERQKLKECDQQIAALEKAVEEMRTSLEGFISQRNVLQVGLDQAAA